MKIKSINLSKIFIVLFLSISLNLILPIRSYSQFVPCPEGWVGDLKIVPVIVGNDTCMYEVGLCLKCDASTHSVPMEIMLTTIRPLDTTCIMNADSAAQYIISTVYDPNWIFQNIQNDCIAGWGPCELQQNWVEVDAISPKCWHWEKFYLSDDDFVSMLIPCGDCECHWSYYICWETMKQKFIQIPNSDKPPYFSGSCPCDAEPNSDCISVETKCDQ